MSEPANSPAASEQNQRVAAALRLSALPGTTNVPHTGSWVIFDRRGRCAAAPRRPPRAPWVMPLKQAPDGADQQQTITRTGTRGGTPPRPPDGPAAGVRLCSPSSALLGGLCFGAVGRGGDHLLPGGARAGEVLLAEGLDDAHVQHGLGVRRIDRQRLLELLDRLVGLVRVVVGDAEVGRDVGVLRAAAAARPRTTATASAYRSASKYRLPSCTRGAGSVGCCRRRRPAS